MEFFGVRLVGLDQNNLHKLLLTVGFVVVIIVARFLLVGLIRLMTGKERNERVIFWARQVVRLGIAIVAVVGFLSIWFDQPQRLTTVVGLISAGLAFALQKVVTAFAGYIVILRGNTFTVGDRITMSGVRGDVISLGFIQTKIMEMGEPPNIEPEKPGVWVKGRQYTGRIVSVTNDKIFDEPVFNYTRDFPYLWDEIRIPVKYGSNRQLAEKLILECARKHTEQYTKLSAPQREAVEKRYFIHTDDLVPRVYYRLTDNWLELAVRFIAPEHGVRELKDAISRDLLDAYERNGLEIASATYDIVGVPTIRVIDERQDQRRAAGA